MESLRDILFYWGVDDKLDLYVRSYGEFTLNPPDRELCRRCDFGEIFWPVDGQGTFLLNNRNYTLRPGYAWYYPPGSLHDYIPKSRFHYCWFAIAGTNCEMLFQLLNIKPGLNQVGVCPRALFNMLGTDLCYHTNQNRLNALATAFKLLTVIATGNSRKKATKNGIPEVKNYIDINFGNPNLSVEQLASDLSMHRGSLSRGFHRTYGVTLSSYIISCRMKNASELLTTTDYSIAEIAHDCGWSSAHYLSEVFTKKIGITPFEFRKRFRKNVTAETEDKK